MPPADPLRSRLERALAGLMSRTAAIGRALHADPELSLEEVRGANLIVSFLRREGFRVRRGAAGLPTAFVARKAGHRRGPRVAFLAEYDALPGIGHACGHNLIGAAAAGAGAALGRVVGEAGGEVLVIGTPAEETIGGKCLMVDRGVFRGIDAALMFHPAVEDRVHTTSLACHSLEVTFRGRAAHAVAAAHRGINALAALLRLFASLERLRRRLPPEVRWPGVIIEGGRRANIVPDRAVGRFTLRAGTLKRLDRVEAVFRRAVRAACRATGARAAIRSLDHPYAEMLTNGVIAEVFKRELARMGRRTVDGPRREMGSLDMGNVSQAVPSIHAYVAIAPRRTPLHSEGFARCAGGRGGLSGLRVATRALALTGLALLQGDGLIERARAEFRARHAASGRGASAPRRARGPGLEGRSLW